jgi:hypothetical protein
MRAGLAEQSVPSRITDNPRQSKRFIEMARKADAIGTTKDLELAFEKIAKAKKAKS